MSKLILVNGQNVEFALDAQTSGTGAMKTPDLAGATRYQVPALSAAAAAEIAKLGVHGADIASATTTNLETATGELVDVTGTTTITAITLSDGHRRVVRFTGILTLTHGASLVLPGAANIVTAAGDVAVFEGYAAGVVRCVGYMRAAAVPPTGINTGDQTMAGLGFHAVRLTAADVVFVEGVGTPTTLATVLQLTGLTAGATYWTEIGGRVLGEAANTNAKIQIPEAVATGRLICVDDNGVIYSTGAGDLAQIASGFLALVAGSLLDFLWTGWCVADGSGRITLKGAQSTSDLGPTTFYASGSAIAGDAATYGYGNTYIRAQKLS